MLQKLCGTCNCVKPPRTHHCSICEACILGMDHHCPWMNNCVGLRNLKSFILFNFYVMVCSAFTLIRLVVSFFGCFFIKPVLKDN